MFRSRLYYVVVVYDVSSIDFSFQAVLSLYLKWTYMEVKALMEYIIHWYVILGMDQMVLHWYLAAWKHFHL